LAVSSAEISGYLRRPLVATAATPLLDATLDVNEQFFDGAKTHN
jgi:hypothetical protein